MGTVRLRDRIVAARGRRHDLLAALPQTDCYRLLHGAVEGWPGLTVDRYGPLLVVQTFREPLSAAQPRTRRADSVAIFPAPRGR